MFQVNPENLKKSGGKPELPGDLSLASANRALRNSSIESLPLRIFFSASDSLRRLPVKKLAFFISVVCFEYKSL